MWALSFTVGGAFHIGDDSDSTGYFSMISDARQRGDRSGQTTAEPQSAGEKLVLFSGARFIEVSAMKLHHGLGR